ncbi:M64 family metallopeptidase [Undibacterium sp. SXout7W]|uniref:M64 family metallopeptidase n=1 Tax=Undibacterium sp. SXout7W TaxID=3413049 RepID=UPI003BEFAE95
MADTTSLLSTGASANRVDIVFVAEGYTAAERTKFLTDANNFLTTMLGSANAKLNAPFSSYKNLFNASALFVASAESGTDQPNKNTYVNTYFNATQHGSDGRLLYGDEDKVNTTVTQAYASDAHEITIVLVNTALYGGAGGSVAWAAAGNSSASEIALHEIGHSFAGLQDEYVDASIANNYPLNSPYFQNSAHVTDSLNRIPWSAWMGYKDGDLGVVGTYQGGYYRANGVWRATLDSKMNHLGVAFSAPEKEAFALQYYAAIGDYLSLNTSIPGLYQAITPDSSLLAFNWAINGKTVDTSSKQYLDAYGTGVYQTGSSLSLSTIDSTGYIRTNLSNTQQTETSGMSKAVSNVSGASANITSSNAILQFDSSDNTISISNLSTTRFDYIDGGAGKDTLQFNTKLGNGSGFFINEISANTAVLGIQGVNYWAEHNVERLQFTDFTVNTAVHTNAQTISGNDLRSLEELYVAYFNRVPDADGLDYWISQYKRGVTMNQIGDEFYKAATQNPVEAGYSKNFNDTDFINTLYKNILARSAGADTEGLTYWLGQLNNGSLSHGSLVNTVLSIIHNSAIDSYWNQVNLLLSNKITVANQFAVEWGLNYNTPEAAITNGAAIIGTVTPIDIAAALALIGINNDQIHLI